MTYILQFAGSAFCRRAARFLCVSALALSASPLHASSSLKPDVMFKIGGLPVTNSMLTAGGFCVLIALFFRFVLLRAGRGKFRRRGRFLWRP